MRNRLTLAVVLALAVPLVACDSGSPQHDDYYARVIQPILNASCSGNTSGCHRADPSDPFKQAAGNFDTTSFENVHKRPDLLRTYGAYPVPLLLIKAVGGTKDLEIAYRNDEFLPLEIQHNSGSLLQVGSPQFVTLQKWLENGATRTGLPPPPAPVEGQGACSTAIPPDFNPVDVTSTPQWAMASTEFDNVMSAITSKGCNASNCHGAPQSDFYITCGDDDTQKAFNFKQVWAFVANPVTDSEVLRRPLDPALGGLSHAGGVKFSSRDDSAYKEIETFANMVGQLDFGQGDPGRQFFADNVMPLLLKRGCAAQGCHSPGAMNDFKLRAGSQGFFSAVALEKNYELAKDEFMAFEVPDPRRGRAVAKNLVPMYGGIKHRGGFVLETPGSPGSEPALCPAVFDPATASAFCVMNEWVKIERASLVAAGQVLPMGAGDTVPIVYVERSANHVAGPLEFDTYQPGSDLLVRDGTLDANGSITGTASQRSIAAGCPGFSQATADVRAPDVANDGTRVAFAMRTSQGDTLNVYTVNLDGTNCVKLTNNGAHNFDPAWSPDGLQIVYASSKEGGMSHSGHLQANLHRMRPDGSADEQITFLSNTEMEPGFMREGRLTMTTEKGDPAPGKFYQLSGRRMNWDLTDYHPLLAQRSQSPFADPMDPTATKPSVGYQQATEIRESLDGDFLVILSDSGAKAGAGTLGIFNRSIGPNEVGRTDPSFVNSLTIPDPAATGRPGAPTDGAYKSPYPLPDGKIMASYAAGNFDLGTVGSLDFDIVAVDPMTGARTTIIGGAGAQVEAVLALKYPARAMYYNRRQLVFGGEQDTSDAAHAIVHVVDAPMIATLLGANLRRGRPVDSFRDADTLAVLDKDGNTVGTAPLASDGSVRVRVPSRTPVFLELRKGSTPIFTMTEEHQFGPGEHISLGVQEKLFNHICGGCHGSVSAEELDISVVPDALTGASQSQSATATPKNIGN